MHCCAFTYTRKLTRVVQAYDAVGSFPSSSHVVIHTHICTYVYICVCIYIYIYVLMHANICVSAEPQAWSV